MKFLYAMQIVGGCIMLVGYFPQVAQIVRTKTVRDLNIKMFVMLSVGLLMMEAYAIGIVVHDHSGQAYLITNTLGLAVNITVAGLIAYYRKPRGAVADATLEGESAAGSAGSAE
ncbi:MAG TPA: PQ-loop domain-containing transporter [Candidatus Anoxymicrobiaceae bacterium]